MGCPTYMFCYCLSSFLFGSAASGRLTTSTCSSDVGYLMNSLCRRHAVLTLVGALFGIGGFDWCAAPASYLQIYHPLTASARLASAAELRALA